MAQWYAQVGSQRYGPVDEEEIRRWYADGRIKSQDYVWAEGMTQWESAGQAFGPPPAAGEPLPPPLPGEMVPPPPGGTGGATPNTDLMSQAWKGMTGRWGIAIGFTLLLILLSMGIQMIPYVGGLAGLLMGGALQLGAAVFFLNYVRGGPSDIGMLFAGFKWFGNAIGTYLLQALFVALWALLLIVPGIIASLAYSQSFYILAENPELSPLDVLRRSKQMMYGYKWKLFCLELWFFLLSLAALLTCGIGYIWLIPYASVTIAGFYDDLKAPAQAPGISAAPAPAGGTF